MSIIWTEILSNQNKQTTDGIEKIVHFGILIHVLSALSCRQKKSTQVFVMNTENFCPDN